NATIEPVLHQGADDSAELFVGSDLYFGIDFYTDTVSSPVDLLDSRGLVDQGEWDSNRLRIYDSLQWRPGTGWFSPSFGPFRRFVGGDSEYDILFQTNYRLAAHLTAFSEGVALTESLRWLQQLQFQRLEDESEKRESASGLLLDHVRAFVNDSGLLPYGV